MKCDRFPRARKRTLASLFKSGIEGLRIKTGRNEDMPKTMNNEMHCTE